jgi:hypothetical protein
MATTNTWQDHDFSPWCYRGVKCAHSRVGSMWEAGEMRLEVQTTAASTQHTAYSSHG